MQSNRGGNGERDDVGATRATDDRPTSMEEMTATLQRLDVDEIPLQLPFRAAWGTEEER